MLTQFESSCSFQFVAVSKESHICDNLNTIVRHHYKNTMIQLNFSDSVRPTDEEMSDIRLNVNAV